MLFYTQSRCTKIAICIAWTRIVTSDFQTEKSDKKNMRKKNTLTVYGWATKLLRKTFFSCKMIIVTSK